MEPNEKYVIITCTNCGNKLQVKPDAVSLFCVKCQTWIQVPGDQKNGKDQ